MQTSSIELAPLGLSSKNCRSGSLEDDLTDQKAPQRSCFDRGSDSHASQNYPPHLTHYPFLSSDLTRHVHVLS